MKIVRSSRYSKDIKKLKASADDIDVLERTIAANPLGGALIQGLKGVRKLRFRIGNRGKRSGGRAIYYLVLTEGVVLMLTAYAKSDKTDLSPDDRSAIAAIVEEFKRG